MAEWIGPGSQPARSLLAAQPHRGEHPSPASLPRPSGRLANLCPQLTRCTTLGRAGWTSRARVGLGWGRQGQPTARRRVAGQGRKVIINRKQLFSLKGGSRPPGSAGSPTATARRGARRRQDRPGREGGRWSEGKGGPRWSPRAEWWGGPAADGRITLRPSLFPDPILPMQSIQGPLASARPRLLLGTADGADGLDCLQPHTQSWTPTGKPTDKPTGKPTGRSAL